MCALVLASLLVPLASAGDLAAATSRAAAFTQSKLRGSRLSSLQTVKKPFVMWQVISSNGQRYSDDDESCSVEGLTPGVCALAYLARPSPAPLAPTNASDCEMCKSRDKLERALIAEIEAALAGNHTGITAGRLQTLQEELQPIFATLPHEGEGGEGGLGYAAARYLLHQHFLRQRSWHVRGLNPAGDGRKPPDDKEALRSRVAGHLLEVMEKRAGKRGLDSKMLAIFVATLEHLIHGDEGERLKQAWVVYGLLPNSVTDRTGAIYVLQMFMAHYIYTGVKVDSGYALTLAKAIEEILMIQRTYDGWPRINSFIEKEVSKREQANGKKLRLEDIIMAADEVLVLFKEVSGAICHDMERSFQSLPGGDSGLVKLTDLRNSAAENFFRESTEFLRELGALEENSEDAFVFTPNYMLGPSNCDGTTSFYDLCCPNACEARKSRLERSLTAAASGTDVTVTVRGIRQQLDSELSPKMRAKLQVLSQGTGGKILLHGLPFAQWLHHTFPLDCPRPREEDFQGMTSLLPDAQRDFQASAKVELWE